MLVVLDTNVWLDWLVFADTTIAPLKAAHASGHLTIVRDAAGEAELERVLDYKAIKPLVGADRRPMLVEAMRAASTLHDGSTKAGRLPPCRDADDQHFLELARDAGAALLVTKDRDLLTLRRAKYGALGFRILTPAEACRELGHRV
jgi:uncharacterized protein